MAFSITREEIKTSAIAVGIFFAGRIINYVLNGTDDPTGRLGGVVSEALTSIRRRYARVSEPIRFTAEIFCKNGYLAYLASRGLYRATDGTISIPSGPAYEQFLGVYLLCYAIHVSRQGMSACLPAPVSGYIAP